MENSPLFISVMIPVRNESKHIAEVLDRLLEQDYPADKFEILVLDGRSEDNTREIVVKYGEKHPNVRLLDNPKRLSSGARNIGIQNAAGDVVLLVDGHCIIDSKLILSKTDEAFRQSGADCLGRPQPLELSHANPMQLAIAAARRSPIGHHPDSFIYAGKSCFSPAISVAVAYRKDAFEKVGLFDERFDAAEDCELNHRIDKAGLKCFFTPDIAVRYVPRATLGGLGKQLTRYGKGRVRLSRKHPETFSWKSFLPAAFIGGIFAGIILCVCLFAFLITGIATPADCCTISVFGFLELGCTIFAAVLCLYAAIVIFESVRIAIQNRRLYYCFYLPAVFATIHLSSGYGLLKEIIFPEAKIKPE